VFLRSAGGCMDGAVHVLNMLSRRNDAIASDGGLTRLAIFLKAALTPSRGGSRGAEEGVPLGPRQSGTRRGSVPFTDPAAHPLLRSADAPVSENPGCPDR